MLGSKILVVVAGLVVGVYLSIRSEVLNDMSIYNNVDWWNMESTPFLGLLKSNAVRLPVFLGFFPPMNSVVLDVGCGGGYLSEALSELGHAVSGIDLSETAIENAKNHATRSNLTIDYRAGSVFDLAYPDAHFDVVVASDVLEHVGDVPRALAEIYRVLKPGGVLAFDCVNRSFRAIYFIYFVMQELLGIIPKGAHDWRLFVTPDEMERMLVNQNFSTSKNEWIGRHWKYSYHSLVTEGRKKFIQGFYVDADLSEFYMGSATKPT